MLIPLQWPCKAPWLQLAAGSGHSSHIDLLEELFEIFNVAFPSSGAEKSNETHGLRRVGYGYK